MELSPIIVSIMVLVVAVAAGFGIAKLSQVMFRKDEDGVVVQTGPVLEFRPFRTSAVILALVMVGALWMVLHFDVTGAVSDDYSRGFIDGSIVMVIFTGLVTSITKLCDDGGESDTVKVVNAMVQQTKDMMQLMREFMQENRK